ncbi:glycosyltransferase family 9 protein, partial [Desulfovibrio sp. OttesenSCG-928-A18]|nr:glycosyltransferase family 9 protein [Desulfovibrio sp. OttesenSCG-928-A18]
LLLPLGDGELVDWPELSLPAKTQALAQDYFSGLHGPVLGMHPGSVWPTKRWPPAYFAQVGALALKRGASVLLFGGPGEEEVCAGVHSEIAQGIDGPTARRLRNLAGSLDLPQLAAYIGRLSCYLSNDSGPMHLAWAQHTPVTALFGPTVRGLGFFPRGEGSTVFERELSCRPCGLHGPKVCPLRHHRCMTEIEPETVWSDVQGKLWPESAPA